VKVGVFYLNGGNQVISSAFPGSSVSFGDGKKEAQAIIDDINAHGGAGGRRLVPSWIAIQATDSDANRQAACLGAVQDAHPVALFAIFNLTAGLAKCVEQANTLMIDVALGAGDEDLYKQAKNLAFSPSQITRDAEQKLVLGLAHAQGKLPAGKPVGIVAQGDDPMYPRVVHNTIEPLLRSWGVPYSEQIVSSGSDTQGMSSAILKFQQEHVDTVVFSFGSGGIPEVLFMQAADQQQFRPAYLMGDSTDTNFVGQEAPAAQIKRISGAGTYPLANVRADQYPSPPTERHCLDVLNKAIGGYSNRYSSLTGTLYCEIMYSFAFVAGHVQGPVTSAGWAQAYHALGSAYTPVTSFTTRFLPGRPDGASSYRELGFGASCSCITYTSPIRPIPAS
jgi:ABC-type branched-subunit amino acid transport system substrate-binding protein